MLTDALTLGCWILELDGEADATLRLTFRDGLTYEEGLLVGAYHAVGEVVRVTISDDVELTIERMVDDVASLTMFTKRHGNGADLLEFGRLVRAD